MTLRELVSTNQCICLIYADVRDYSENGGKLMKSYHIGLTATKDRYPMDGKDRWIAIEKSINSKDDGKDYWHTKVDVIPKELLELEVNGWSLWIERTSNNGLNKHYWLNVSLVGKGKQLPEPKEEKQPEEKQLEGQMDITDFL